MKVQFLTVLVFLFFLQTNLTEAKKKKKKQKVPKVVFYDDFCLNITESFHQDDHWAIKEYTREVCVKSDLELIKKRSYFHATQTYFYEEQVMDFKTGI
jgi:hypothetical protein